MRPPEFTGGNLPRRIRRTVRCTVASMRPPEFTGGNKHDSTENHRRITLQ